MTDSPRPLPHHASVAALCRELDRTRDAMARDWVRYRTASLLDLHVDPKQARRDAWNAACSAAGITHALSGVLAAAADEFGADVAHRLACVVDDLLNEGVPGVPPVPETTREEKAS